jgi:hypothetical protein
MPSGYHPSGAGRRLVGLLAAWAALALLAGAAPAGGAEPTPATVDVLALYTPGVTQLYGSGVDTRIGHVVDVTNQVYATSEAGIRIHVVHSQEVAYSDTAHSHDALDAVTNNLGVFAGVEALRTTHGADLVVLLRPYTGDRICGVAWVGGYHSSGNLSFSRRYGYSHVSIDCSTTTLAHELGHNMGLTHSRRQDGSGGTFPWALGHGVDGSFVTIMAYGSAFGAPRQGVFSNPVLTCNGVPCGVNASDPVNGADAADTLRHVSGQLADYTASVVPSGPTQPGDPSTPGAQPPAQGETVDLISPGGGRARVRQPISIQWTASAGVDHVDVFWRGSKKRHRGWRPVALDVTTGQAEWTPRKGHRGSRIRFLTRAYDASDNQVAKDVSRRVRVR